MIEKLVETGRKNRQKRDKIVIQKSKTADTRSCDWSEVTKHQLMSSSKQHIGDVKKAMDFFCKELKKSGELHDHDKISDIDGFHSNFITGFQTRDWLDRHQKKNRHHIGDPSGQPEDINLIDVLEYIGDCVMAGMGRSGEVYDLKLPDELLQKALKNTVEMLKSVVEVEDSSSQSDK